MTFIESVKTCFRKYVDFKGRATRSEFWWFQLLGMIVGIGSSVTDAVFFSDLLIIGISPLTMITTLTLLLPNAAVFARRLHDIGWSAWLQIPFYVSYLSSLNFLLPGFSTSALVLSLVGFGILFWFGLLMILIKDSQPKSNKYGPNPKKPDMDRVFS